MKNLVENAIAVAHTYHAGQVDKQDAPYILHPLRVMLQFKPHDAVLQAVAVLHDVIEDSAVTAEFLLNAGFPKEVVDAVVCLTRSRDENYRAYLMRCWRHPIARLVKMADVEDNLQRITPALEHMRQKYEFAKRFLIDGPRHERWTATATVTRELWADVKAFYEFAKSLGPRNADPDSVRPEFVVTGPSHDEDADIAIEVTGSAICLT